VSKTMEQTCMRDRKRRLNDGNGGIWFPQASRPSAVRAQPWAEDPCGLGGFLGSAACGHCGSSAGNNHVCVGGASDSIVLPIWTDADTLGQQSPLPRPPLNSPLWRGLSRQCVHPRHRGSRTKLSWRGGFRDERRLCLGGRGEAWGG
jgi:hypothetical protein